MLRSLHPHPESRSGAVRSIEAGVERAGARVGPRYVPVGDLEAVLLPPPAPLRAVQEACCLRHFAL